MIRRLLQHPEWAPRALDLCGFACITGGVLLLLGVAPALLVAGVVLIVIAYSAD